MDLTQNHLYINQYIFKKEKIKSIEKEQEHTSNHPIIYILYDDLKKVAYVGESTNVTKRMNDHLKNIDKKRLKYLYVISSPYFNKSAALDIESNLIKYMSADTGYSLLNGNAGIVEHNYYQKRYYFEIFENIWKNLKLKKVVAKDILDIDNSDLYKYSPYKSLSVDQNEVVIQYLERLSNQKEGPVFVEGSAGTGKTILAVYLIKLLVTHVTIDSIDKENTDILEKYQKINSFRNYLQKSPEIALVVPMTSLRKTLKNVFKSIPGLKANMVIGPSEVVKKDYDILIIDEAHRLKRRKGLTAYGSFDNTNKSLGMGHEGTELDWILSKSKYQMFFYDEAQSIRPSDISKKTFSKLKNTENTIKLSSQLRVKAGIDYIKFVNHLLTKKNVQNLKKFSSPNYELALFSNLQEMIHQLEYKEKKYGLTRMTAGFSWKWVSSNGTDAYDALIDGVKMTWNRETKDWINSTNSLTEMGCIHTTQGYDLNYCGVIFGNEIIYNTKTNKIEIVKDNYFDTKGKGGVNDDDLHLYIINIYKTLMYRGIKGTFVYCCDKNLERYFSTFISLQ
ncbi:conserved hypothetical protein [Tenacibaculum litopenaei]|uniref:DNA/RNA helicase domain-containing protein n=1 Tax=Tenacibaculum litopenaei TaxID=396016 RepID=UPI0038932D60